MKLERALHNPGELLEFYEQGLESLGALCERTWHDRLEVVAEDRPAKLWNSDGTLHEVELQFAPADATSARDAAREVFPGCPLTFQLAEALWSSPLPLDRFVLPESSPARLPEAPVAEKIWRAQFPETTRWQLASAWKPAFHFSLLALARCELQAINQHWSLHRVAVSLTDGASDDALARDIAFHGNGHVQDAETIWPRPGSNQCQELLKKAFEEELAVELEAVRMRQEKSLGHELERIDHYFENYALELTSRAKRSANETTRVKTADRLAAARAEHERRRSDQLARHEITVHLHLDALLLIAEKSWRAQIQADRHRRAEIVEALFVPRSRQWKVAPERPN